jgi:hypothetical protein
MAIINTLVEGDLDEAAAKKIVSATDHIPGVCYGKQGWGYIRKKVGGFNNAARALYCLTLVDFMDTGIDCPPDVVIQWLPYRRPRMLFRVVVRELESWLIADRANLANFLRIDIGLITNHPEQLDDPKRELVNLARHSKYRGIRSALVPDAGSTAQVGKLYVSEMTRFINESWDVGTARHGAPSLDRCLGVLEGIP